MSDTKYVTLEGFTARYGMGRSSAYNLLSAGKLSAVKCGRRLLISCESADAYFAGLAPAELHCGRRSR